MHTPSLHLPPRFTFSDVPLYLAGFHFPGVCCFSLHLEVVTEPAGGTTASHRCFFLHGLPRAACSGRRAFTFSGSLSPRTHSRVIIFLGWVFPFYFTRDREALGFFRDRDRVQKGLFSVGLFGLFSFLIIMSALVFCLFIIMRLVCWIVCLRYLTRTRFFSSPSWLLHSLVVMMVIMIVVVCWKVG